MKNPTQVAVIGAGISGLACAYRLQRLGLDVTVFESNSAAGGMIDSVEQNGVLFEAGPQSFQGTPTLLDLIRELDLESLMQKADPRAPRYILLHGHHDDPDGHYCHNDWRYHLYDRSRTESGSVAVGEYVAGKDQ